MLTYTPTEPDVPEPEPDEPVEPEERLPILQAASPAPRVVPLRASSASRPDLTLAGLAGIISAGMQRNTRAAGIQAQIQAALTNVTTTDIAGIVRPAYRAELLALIDHGMPLVDVLANRPLPASGMRIEYPKWGDPPDSTAVQASEKTAVASGPVTVTVVGDNIQTWSQGNDISFQAMQRSDPTFIDAYLRAAAVDAGRKYDTSVGTDLLAAATVGVLPTTMTFINCVKALFTALNPALVPPGPMFLAMSYDVGLSLITTKVNDGPAYWDATISLGSFTPDLTAAGLTIFTDWNLPAQTMLLGSRAAAATYGGPASSADVRVVDVSLLGVDIGVYFYAVLAIEYPGALAKLSLVVIPASADEPAPTAKSK